MNGTASRTRRRDAPWPALPVLVQAGPRLTVLPGSLDVPARFHVASLAEPRDAGSSHGGPDNRTEPPETPHCTPPSGEATNDAPAVPNESQTATLILSTLALIGNVRRLARRGGPQQRLRQGGLVRERSPQGRWLRNDLAANTSRCALAYSHRPLYSTGVNVAGPQVSPLWDMLHDRRADVIVTGRAHRYERFTPMTQEGAHSENGIRQFVVGTGGQPRRRDLLRRRPQRAAREDRRVRRPQARPSPRLLRVEVRPRGPELHGPGHHQLLPSHPARSSTLHARFGRLLWCRGEGPGEALWGDLRVGQGRSGSRRGPLVGSGWRERQAFFSSASFRWRTLSSVRPSPARFFVWWGSPRMS